MKRSCKTKPLRGGLHGLVRRGHRSLREELCGRRRPLRAFLLTVVALPWVLMGVPSSYTQESKHTEYEVKAAYLYNFGTFVEWPAQLTGVKRDTFTICVLGQDPFGPTLDATVAGESIAGKSVMAKRISKPQDATECYILFISSAEERNLNDIVPALARTSVLTVSDMPEFTRRGGMVQFILEGARVRFEVNLAAAERAGLRLSSQLLKLAVNTKRTGLGEMKDEHQKRLLTIIHHPSDDVLPSGSEESRFETRFLAAARNDRRRPRASFIAL